MKQFFRVVWMAMCDLRHEAAVTLCVSMALGTIVVPLLLLTGLKDGVVGTMRSQLLSNPRILEVTPAQVMRPERGKEFFEALEGMEGVARVFPQFGRSESEIDVIAAGGLTGEAVALISTGAGDPMLEKSGIAFAGQPDLGCVLSEVLAKKLNLRVGGQLTLRVGRTRHGAPEFGTRKLELIGVVAKKFHATEAVFMPPEFIEKCAAFSAGSAVKEFGWDGPERRALSGEYDGVMWFPGRAVEAEWAARIIDELSGYVSFSVVDDPRALGLHLPPGARLAFPAILFRWDTLDHREMDEAKLDEFREMIARKGGVSKEDGDIGRAVGWVDVAALGVSSKTAGALRWLVIDDVATLPGMLIDGERAVPKGKAVGGEKPSPPRWRAFAIGGELPVPEDLLGQVAGRRALSFPVDWAALPGVPFAGGAPSVGVGPGFASVLKRAARGDAVVDAGAGTIVRKEWLYPQFRLYATGPDQVERLAAAIEKDFQVPVVTRLAEIASMQQLDDDLGRLLLVISIVVGTAGFLALASNLVLSAQRKARDVAAMKLLGVRTLPLLCFPIIQGLVLTLLGFAIAAALYAIFAVTVNDLYAADLTGSERFCRLAPSKFAILGVTVIGLGVLSALGAAFSVYRVRPDVVLRND